MYVLVGSLPFHVALKTEDLRSVSAMVQLEVKQLLAMTIVLCSHRQEPVEEPQPISEAAWSRHCFWIVVNILLLM